MDLGILHWIRDNLNQPWLIQLFRFITFLGDGGILWIGCAVFFWLKGKRRQAVYLLLSLALTSLCVDGVMKHLVLRARPFVTDPSLIPRITAPLSSSFPSGHSATSMSCAVFLFMNEKNRLGKGLLITGLLIAISRLIVLVHYPTDVVSGIIVGSLIGYFVSFWMNQRDKKMSENQADSDF